MAIDTEKMAGQILAEGFCLLRQHFPREAVEACRRAFAPKLDEYVAEHADKPNRGPCRHYIALPFEPPFYNPRFFDDDDVVAIVGRILGRDMCIDQYASDTPLQGSVYQDVHADIGPLFDEEPHMWHPPALIAVNFPFVDVTPERGPFEVARGTHRLPKEEALGRIEEGEFPLEPLLLEAGDVLIRDPRCLHRGTPNRTDTPRGVAVIGIRRRWFSRNRESNPVPRVVWEGLSERERQLMRELG